MADTVVIGVGNPLRGDDGAGPAVVERIRTRLRGDAAAVSCSGEPWDLIESWRCARLAVVVDAMASGAPPGTVRRIDPDAETIPPQPAGASTHGMGLAEAIHLAGALRRLPERIVVFGVEVAGCRHGEGLSREVEAAVEEVTELILDEIDA